MIFRIFGIAFKNKVHFFKVLGYKKAIQKNQVIRQYGSYENLVITRTGIIEPEKIKTYLEIAKKDYDAAQYKKHDNDKKVLSDSVKKNEISEDTLKFLIFVYNSLPNNEREKYMATFAFLCPEGHEKIMDEIRGFESF